MLNLLNFVKITKLTTVNFFNSYSLQCFESKLAPFVSIIVSGLLLTLDFLCLFLCAQAPCPNIQQTEFAPRARAQLIPGAWAVAGARAPASV